ncbi:MAG: CHASE3 domain-containing protein [Planctomycetaceae bacterium]|nr:CHASE3 domain-containing protein [Planctomycetaceae bacterium]
MNPRSFNWITIALTVAAIIVSVICGLAIRKGAQAEQTSNEIFHQYELRKILKDILSSLKDAETGERGFLITGNDDYLEPYHVGVNKAMEDLTELQKFVDSGNMSAAELQTLSELIEGRHQDLEQTITKRREVEGDEGFLLAREIIETDRGRLLMHKLREMIAAFLLHIDERLEQLHQEVSDHKAVHAVLISLGLMVSIGTFVAAAITTNIERRQRAHAVEAMQTQQARMTAIVDSALDAVISVDSDGRVVMMNPMAEDIFLRREREMLGQPLELLIPERFRSLHASHMKNFARDRVVRKRILDGGLIRGLRADGMEFPAEASVSRTMLNDGPLFTVILKDVSERETGRMRIREQNAILARIRDAVHVRDLDGRIMFWNEGAEKLYGWSAEEAVGQQAFALLRSADDEEDGVIREQVLAHGAWHGDRVVRTRDDRELIIESRRSLIVGDDEEPVSQLVIDIDVTEEHHRQQIERRSQRLTSIGTLASGIAHDLNNVLTPITMGAKLLKRTATDPQRLQIIQSISTSAERGAAMIRQLLAFAGGTTGPRESINVSELLEEARAILVHALPKTIRVSVELNGVLWPVRGDATELSQVLMNLAINARDAMPNGGQVVFEATNATVDADSKTTSPRTSGLRSGRYVQITVIDQGQGILPELIDKVFDPFFTTKEQGKGTGLGLATCMGIVTSHGGTISVTSEPGKGTRFSVLLPAESEPASELVPPEPEAPPEGHGERILLIDDEDSILQMLEAVLQSYGYNVVTANSGLAVISLWKHEAESFAAVIIDMMMPEMDGEATIAHLRAVNSTVPIIASSGLRKPEQGTDSIAGTNAFLPKPYTDELVLKTLKRVLQERE